jgi:hypothetical protein
VTQPTSRWARSEVTFGPIGRIVCTALLIAPILFALFYSVFFLIAAVIWLFVLPVALRDVWRAVKVRGTAEPIVMPPELEPPAPGESINDRKPPTRW